MDLAPKTDAQLNDHGCFKNEQLPKPEKHIYEKLTFKEQAAFDNMIHPLELAAQRIFNFYF